MRAKSRPSMSHALFIALLSLVVEGCSYSSKTMAIKACGDWKARQNKVIISSYRDEQPSTPVDRRKELKHILRMTEAEDLSAYRDAEQFRAETIEFHQDFYKDLEKEDTEGREMIDHRVTARWCSDDKDSKQILGFENKAVISKAWQNKQGAKGKGDLVKRFRY